MRTKILGYFGIITLIVYWSFTIASILQNPWFSVMHNALSDLGSDSACCPWIYNYGLILASPFLLVFSLYLIYSAQNKLETVGGAFISISSIFLALIGVFHSGTRPHTFVAPYFFLQFFVGMLVWGIGTWGAIKKLTIALFILAFIGAFIPWPSTATLEIYEIALIGIFVSAFPSIKED
ncbi:putative membrane protein [Aciduliprofundum sp. MAR08-339]|uniref:DUF998 domain-containing protein n=1 Tax=Aciduliprofundum sp. (strain MAR08-339) TaxID=673860 RepID=UPI0002A4C595|nr:putative membrane protein [Aciduliprofundum sp. MAR08-339]